MLQSFQTSIRRAGDDGAVFRKEVRSGILLAITSAIAIYGLMFGTGGILYGEFVQGAIWLLLAIASGSASVVLWQRLPG